MAASTNWSLSKDTWNLLAQCDSIGGWNSVRLLPEFRPIVPQAPGVYLMAAPPPLGASHRLPPNLYNVLYVGKTDNLRRRFTEHIKTPSEAVREAKRTYGIGRVDFHYTILSLNHISPVEGLLWLALGPSANDMTPPFLGRILEATGPNPERKLPI